MDTLGSRFDALGKERAFEFAVLEWPYYFWQYHGPLWACDSLPSPDAPSGEFFDFLSLVASPDYNFGDEALAFYAPYFYQAATQLGAPRYPEAHLRPLLRYPGQDVVTNFPPLSVDKRFVVTAMLEVAKWMRKDARRMLPVYGELDPWSTGAFEVDAANDSFRVFVPGPATSPRSSTCPSPSAAVRRRSWASGWASG
jgi:hypothetical protein